MRSRWPPPAHDVRLHDDNHEGHGEHEEGRKKTSCLSIVSGRAACVRAPLPKIVDNLRALRFASFQHTHPGPCAVTTKTVRATLRITFLGSAHGPLSDARTIIPAILSASPPARGAVAMPSRRDTMHNREYCAEQYWTCPNSVRHEICASHFTSLWHAAS
jgi:hypothetical protein